MAQSQSTGGHDAMKVWMEDEIAPPGVHDRGDAEQSTESLWIAGQLQERLAGGREQQIEQRCLVQAHQLAQLSGKSEDNVEMTDGQRLLHAR